MTRPLAVGLLFVCVAALSGCAHGAKPKTASQPRQASGEDARARLIAAADVLVAAGLAEVKAGHLVSARAEFDKAVDLYLAAPGGALAHPAVAAAYRRTLEEIHVAELEALAQVDGFAEGQSEPASIDTLGEIHVPEGQASEETRRTAEQAVRSEANDLPVELNDAVLGCIELYQGPLRDWFERALARGGRYLPRIREVFAAEGLPQDLAYVALVESAFKPSALSRAKARGVWQFMPDTGRRFGLKQDWWVDERSDPEKATRAAAQYLKSLYGMFSDWNLALAGYNSGEGRVIRALSRTDGDGSFWDLASRKSLPKETRNYVPMIHAAIVVAKAPETYGFEVEPEPELEFDQVPVAGAVDLRVIAECAGQPFEEIQSLNPSLRRLATPARGTFDVRVPRGSGTGVAECLSTLPAERRVTFRTHVVGRGQTLAAIAKRYGVKTATIADANMLGRGKKLAIGTELLIPVEARPAPPTRTAAASLPARGADPASEKKVVYRIKAGDTLSRIASLYKTTVEQLKAWNGLRSTQLATGRTLTIYTSRPF